MTVVIRNLTPHQVVVSPSGDITQSITLESEGSPSRVTAKRTVIAYLQVDSLDIPIHALHYDGVPDLPNEVEGTFLIVSRLVAERFLKRKDLLIPDELIRDDSGTVVACQSLSSLSLSD